MNRPLIIYHAPCSDGFAAAYAAWRHFGGNADYVGVDHQAYPTLDVADRDVYVLDFSFPRPMLEDLRAKAQSLIILDHHKTSQEDLAGFPGAFFDMTKCGARMAWEYFHPGKPVPQLIEFVEDRDLWVWRDERSSDFLAYLDTLPFDFDAWHRLTRLWPSELADILNAGHQMNQKLDSLAQTMADDAEPVRMCGIEGSRVNASYLFSNLVGEKLYLRNETFAMVWRLEKGKLYVSLRSREGTVDVAEMARKFGGGGHACASAFKLPVGGLACAQFMRQYIMGSGEAA